MKHKFPLLVLVILIALTGCTYVSTPQTKTDFAMDTVIRVSVYGENNTDILTQAIDLCKQYERIFSKTIPESDISRLNAAKGAVTELSADTVALLELAQEYCELSHEKFDITIAPISELWNVTQNYPVVPKQKQISEALKKVDLKNLTVTSSALTASLSNGAKVDLGGLAKGYTADRMADFLRQNGVESAVIDLGGNVYALGTRNGEPFRIGIAYPFAEDDGLLGSIQVSNKAVVSSGVYQRYFKMDGKLYHHIFDPNTGYPAETDLYSVTIICDNGARADALSTVCMLLGESRGMELIQSLPDVDAVFITSNNKVYVTPGFTQQYAPEFNYEYFELVQ